MAYTPSTDYLDRERAWEVEDFTSARSEKETLTYDRKAII